MNTVQLKILTFIGKKASNCYVFLPFVWTKSIYRFKYKFSSKQHRAILFIYIIHYSTLSASLDMTGNWILLCVCIAKWGPYPCLRLCGTIVIMWLCSKHCCHCPMEMHSTCFILFQAVICMVPLCCLHSLDIQGQLKHLSVGCLVWLFLNYRNEITDILNESSSNFHNIHFSFENGKSCKNKRVAS